MPGRIDDSRDMTQTDVRVAYIGRQRGAEVGAELDVLVGADQRKLVREKRQTSTAFDIKDILATVTPDVLPLIALADRFDGRIRSYMEDKAIGLKPLQEIGAY